MWHWEEADIDIVSDLYYNKRLLDVHFPFYYELRFVSWFDTALMHKCPLNNVLTSVVCHIPNQVFVTEGT